MHNSTQPRQRKKKPIAMQQLAEECRYTMTISKRKKTGRKSNGKKATPHTPFRRNKQNDVDLHATMQKDEEKAKNPCTTTCEIQPVKPHQRLTHESSTKKEMRAKQKNEIKMRRERWLIPISVQEAKKNPKRHRDRTGNQMREGRGAGRGAPRGTQDADYFPKA